MEGNKEEQVGIMEGNKERQVGNMKGNMEENKDGKVGNMEGNKDGKVGNMVLNKDGKVGSMEGNMDGKVCRDDKLNRYRVANEEGMWGENYEKKTQSDDAISVNACPVTNAMLGATTSAANASFKEANDCEEGTVYLMKGKRSLLTLSAHPVVELITFSPDNYQLQAAFLVLDWTFVVPEKPQWSGVFALVR
ncbi:uncharacterized protein V6R79_019546 [Siganus canaliculatus]